MADPKELYDCILTGNAKKAEAVRGSAGRQRRSERIGHKYMIPAMDEVGQRFECNEYFVPELLIAARAMKAALGAHHAALLAKRASSRPAGW